MALLLFITIHWYFSLFFQSIFHHRYAAHGMFTMNRSWEKAFYIGCFISQGSSYISAKTYGLMHRLHHAHTDSENDPHSPHHTTNALGMLLQTRNSYNEIHLQKTTVPQKYYYDLPEWDVFDRFAHNWITRLVWGAVYVLIYSFLVTEWWQYLFLPITFAMGALQGLAVNWWAHKFGYENFDTGNTSKNILPIDLIFWGEAYHNNHHKHPGRPNNAIKWFEFDFGYAAMKTMHAFGIIKMKCTN